MYSEEQPANEQTEVYIQQIPLKKLLVHYTLWDGYLHLAHVGAIAPQTCYYWAITLRVMLALDQTLLGTVFIVRTVLYGTLHLVHKLRSADSKSHCLRRS
jgi:hypothetical protein